MDRDLNHDEHQFLAPAALWANEGLQPYRDFPLHHLPNLVYIYGVFLSMSGHLVFGAKLACFLATVFTFCLLIRAANIRRVPLCLVGSIILLLLADPLFRFTSGKTWNHEIPTAFALLALMLQGQALATLRPMWTFAAGVALSAAIGCRLTFLPIALPFALSLCWIPASQSQSSSQSAWKTRGLFLASFALGGLLGGLPTLLTFASAPDAFLFGNLEFPRMRLLDPNDERARETAVWWRKIRYLFKEVLRPSWALILAGLLILLPRWRRSSARSADTSATSTPSAPAPQTLGDPAIESTGTQSAPTRDTAAQSIEDTTDNDAIANTLQTTAAAGQPPPLIPLSLAYGTLAASILGCALPTRYQWQHWFIVVPLIAFIIVQQAPTRLPRWRIIALTFLSIICVYRAVPDYAALSGLAHPSDWFAFRIHTIGREIRQRAGDGRVLTLAPTWPLEGGCRIYPALVTGPFTWRLAHWMAPERRAHFGVWAPEDLQAHLKGDQPAAIYTGFEKGDIEKQFIDFAREQEYEVVVIHGKRMLWLPRPATGKPKPSP